MAKCKKDLRPMYGIIKKMYEGGEDVKTIEELLGISNYSVYKALSVMGIESRLQRKKIKEELELNYADNSAPILEEVVIYGQWKEKDGIRYRTKKIFTDIAPLFIPR